MFVTYAYGWLMNQMIKDGSIVRELSALENLPNIQEICTDLRHLTHEKYKMRNRWVHGMNITLSTSENEPMGDMHGNSCWESLSKCWCVSTLSLSEYEDRFACGAIEAVTCKDFCRLERENWMSITEHPKNTPQEQRVLLRN